MCKTGRKINKINFNKLIWLYWKMETNIYIYIYIYIIFFCDFPVAGMKKKRLQKRNWMGYCPFSQFESRYNFCIVTQGNTIGWPGRKGLGHDTASHAHDTAEQCCDTTERKA